MYKTEYNIKKFSSARSGRVSKVVLAPPFLIYALFGFSILVQLPVGYVIRYISFSAGMLLNQLGTLLIPVLFVIYYFGLTKKEVLPFNKIKRSQLIAAIIMMGSLAIITDYLLSLTEWALPISKHLEETYRELLKVTGFWSVIHKFLFLCILPSFCEEVFFRGFCQTGLSKNYGKWIGILITAGMFSVAHLSPWYIHLYFILGIFLGWMFMTSGSLWIPIICHVINNLWTFSTHALHFHLPLKGDHIWMNYPIIAITLITFATTILVWIRLCRPEENYRQSQNGLL